MARHRSPRGRRTSQPVAPGRAVTGVFRSTPTPLRRGATVVAVTGGALTLVGATSAVPPGPADLDAAVAQAAFGVDPGRGGQEIVLPVQMLSAVQPVAETPPALDASELVKAVQIQEVLAAEQAARAEAERVEAEQVAAEKRAAEERAAQAEREKAERAAAADCGMNTSGLGAVKPFVRDAAEFLGCRYGEPTLIGVASRSGASDHPTGRAVDFMVDRTTGDALAACALDNMDELGISYVIWEQQINHGNGWQRMEDRGGVTANHFDHVHISFGTSAGGNPNPC